MSRPVRLAVRQMLAQQQRLAHAHLSTLRDLEAACAQRGIEPACAAYVHGRLDAVMFELVYGPAKDGHRRVAVDTGQRDPVAWQHAVLLTHLANAWCDLWALRSQRAARGPASASDVDE